MKKLFSALGLSIILCFNLFGQSTEDIIRHRVKAMIEVPTQFSLGYELMLSHKISTNFQVGLLSEPNTSIILFSLEEFGTDETVILMIEDCFTSGLVLEGGINYNFRRYYVGVFAQNLMLTGKDTPRDIVENVMGVSIQESPERRRRNSLDDSNLTLKSNLFQLGLLLGRRFPLKGGKTEIDLEVGFSKNITSTNTISSDDYEIGALNYNIDIYLDNIYQQYAYIPSLTLAFVRKLN